ncbi:MAG: hypothetical protein ACLUS5_03380 [Roseburia faecis]
MKKIGSKVLLMMVLFVVIFGLNTITSVRSQNRVKRSGLEITEQYIPIQTEIFTIQKSMERGQKYLNIISLYDNAELRQQLEGSLAEEVSTITESEKKIDVYLKDNNNTKLKDAIKKYEEFLDKVLLQFSTIQEYVDTGDFAQASIALDPISKILLEIWERKRKRISRKIWKVEFLNSQSCIIRQLI